MNYTTNYHLPQWAETDRIMMEDFNDAMETIDQGLAALPYVMGSYTGNNGTITINLGFRPSFVVVMGNAGYNDSMQDSIRYSGYFADGHTFDTVTVTDTGFSITREAYHYPELNDGGKKYRYVAFR